MAKKHTKGVVRRLKVITSDGGKQFVNSYNYVNTDKTDSELVNFVQSANMLSANKVTRIIRTDIESLTDDETEPEFEKVEGVAVYNADGKLVNSKMVFATADNISAMLNGAEPENPVESGTSAYTVAVYDNTGKLTNANIQFATNADVAAMLNDNTPANFDNTSGYSLAMVTSDGKLTDSGIGFATAADINAFIAEQFTA